MGNNGNCAASAILRIALSWEPYVGLLVLAQVLDSNSSYPHAQAAGCHLDLPGDDGRLHRPSADVVPATATLSSATPALVKVTSGSN